MGLSTKGVAWLRLILLSIVVFMLGGPIARMIYRQFGLSLLTTGAVLLLIGAVGYLGLRMEGITLARAGGSVAHIIRAVLALAGSYGLFLLLLMGLKSVGIVTGPILRSLTWQGFLDNWILTGGGEELFFRGFLLIGLARLVDRKPLAWRALLLSAVLFSLFHLPFALWAGKQGGDLALDLGIPLVSALLVFGPAYLLSRNLWLVALLHGVTDYPIIPQIKDNPLLGLVFMVIALVIGYLFRAPHSLPLSVEPVDRTASASHVS